MASVFRPSSVLIYCHKASNPLMKVQSTVVITVSLLLQYVGECNLARTACKLLDKEEGAFPKRWEEDH